MEEEEIERDVNAILGTAVSLVFDDASEDMTLNSSLMNATTGVDVLVNSTGSTSPTSAVVRHLPFTTQLLITFCYVFGIAGNLAALYIITKSETQRYKKQTLMLQCLAGNDLVALVGSFVQMYMHLYLPVSSTKWFCAFRVLWRAFGIGSGCVAVVMAVDRWLALSHPFIYQKHVTYTVVRRSILGLWTLNLLLSCAPFLGFGLWYDEESQLGVTACVRYRHGSTVVDRAYAYLVFGFGIVMCAVIVCCNLAVIRVLCDMRKRFIPRRHSRASCRSSSSITDPSANQATIEEVSFAKLMAIISIFFVVCWVPQLMTIIVAQLEGSIPKIGTKVYRIADIFIALNFTIDPYMYVVFRRQRRCNNRHIRKLASYLCPSKQQESSNGIINGSLRSSSHNSSNNTAGKGFGTRNGSKITISTNFPSSEKEYVPLHLLLSHSPVDKIQSDVSKSSESHHEDDLLPVQNGELSPILRRESETADPNKCNDSKEAI